MTSTDKPCTPDTDQKTARIGGAPKGEPVNQGPQGQEHGGEETRSHPRYAAENLAQRQSFGDLVDLGFRAAPYSVATTDDGLGRAATEGDDGHISLLSNTLTVDGVIDER
jgi:hypothetical protein